MFQSPRGDSFFSDLLMPQTSVKCGSCFNPLAGIRSFLTDSTGQLFHKETEFQSPRGDSFFSD